jgi:6-phosphofructokinase 2
MKSIVTLTANPVIDVAASVPKIFPDHKLRCGVARRDAGGGGIDVSRAIRLLGGESFACYFAGGPSGDMLEALLDAETLLHRRLPIKEWTRENFTATEEATGSQFRFALRGPELSKKEWQRGLDLLASVEPTPDFASPAAASPPVCPTIAMRISRAQCGNAAPASSLIPPPAIGRSGPSRSFFNQTELARDARTDG